MLWLVISRNIFKNGNQIMKGKLIMNHQNIKITKGLMLVRDYNNKIRFHKNKIRINYNYLNLKKRKFNYLKENLKKTILSVYYLKWISLKIRLNNKKS